MKQNASSTNYYDILHVQPSAPPAIIKNAYRAIMLSMKQHPDLGGDTDKAALINQAYETLSDEEKRAEYDQMLVEQQHNSNSSVTEPDSFKQSQNQSNTQPQKPIDEKTGSRCPFCYQFNRVPSAELIDCSGCSSPLDPPLSGLSSDKVARSIDRVPKDTAIQILEDSQSQAKIANLRDLSPHGLGFVLDGNLSAQQVVKVACSLFEGLATIAHKRPIENGQVFYGAQFLTLRFHSTSGNFISTHL